MDMNKRQIQVYGGLVEQLLGFSQMQNAMLLAENVLVKSPKWLQLGSTVLALPILCMLLFPSLSIASQIGQSGSGFLLAQNTVQRQRRVALVIGNAAYVNTRPLSNPSNDATDIAQALQGLGFEVILLKNAGQQQMDVAVGEFSRKLRQSDVGLFYYAGHAVQVGKRNYLIPIDAKINRDENINAVSVPLEKILWGMANSGNSINLVLLDACRDNPFPANWRSVWESNSRGLASVTAEGTLISFATSPDEKALDGDGRNSPYTASVLQHIGEPGLPVELMFKKVRQSVSERTGKKQRTSEENYLIGDFIFKPRDIDFTPLTPLPSKPRISPPIQPVDPPAAASGSVVSVPSSETAALEFFNKGREKSKSYQNQNQEEAILAYGQAIKLKPDYAEAYYYRGYAREIKQDYNGAIEDYDQAIKYKPDYGLAYKGRGDIRPNLMSRDNQSALVDLNQAIKLLQLNTDQESKEALPEAHHRRGKVRMATGNIQGAIDDFNEMLNLQTALADETTNEDGLTSYFSVPSYGYTLREEAYLKLGNPRKAISDYSELIKQNPEYRAEKYYARDIVAENYYARGVVYESLADKQNAIADFQKALEIYRKNYNADGYKRVENRLKKFNITVSKYPEKTNN
jgi:tetratricopeptide (TPR) repeat protein